MTGNATARPMWPSSDNVSETNVSGLKFQHVSLRLNIVLDRIYNAKICDFGLTQFRLQALRLLW